MTRILVMLIAVAIACVAIRGIAPALESSDAAAAFVQEDLDVAPPPAAPAIVAVVQRIERALVTQPSVHAHRHVSRLFRPPRAAAV